MQPTTALPRTAGVYQILNTVSGSSYIGSAHDLLQRYRSHCSALKTGRKPPPKLKRAWDKYGAAVFEFRVLLQCSKEQSLFYEQRAIDTLTPKYNTRPLAHSNIGIKWSAESNSKKARKDTKQFVVQGRTGSVFQLAAHFSICPKLVRSRLDRGQSVEDAFLRPAMTPHEVGVQSSKARAAAGHKPTGRAETYRGVTASLAQLVEQFGQVSYRSVLARLSRGWTLAQALETGKGDTHSDRRSKAELCMTAHTIVRTVLGVTGTTRQLAEHFGVVSPGLAGERIRNGMAPDLAFTTPKGPTAARRTR